MVLSGARHLGKTTIAGTFSDIYFDIEREEDLTRLDIEWGWHMRGEELVILDEIQHAPELFLRLRAIIDEQYGQNGRFLLTESFASPLIKSLEGRVIVCELSPLLIDEVDEEQQDALWATGGGYPENIGALEPFPSWQQHYLDQMVQRDLPNWGFPASPRVTERLFKMLASVHGQLWVGASWGGLGHQTDDQPP